jgi:integrase/recombinase XerD
VVELEQESMEACKKLLADFVRWMKLRGFSGSSQKSYPQSVKSFFALLSDKGIVEDESIDVGAITPQIVAEYQAWLYERVSPKTYAKLCANTQLVMLGILITFCRFLLSTHRIVKDPCCDLRLPRQIRRLPKDLLTPKEVKKLLSVPDTNTVVGFRDRVMLEIFWCTGMRISELLSLAVEDINFREGLVTIRQGKGAKDRVVPIGEGALEWMREYIERVRPLLLKSFKYQGDLLFPGRNGKRFDKSGFQAKLQVYRRRARLKKKVTTHTFRHTLATEMLKRGADLRHIQEMLGHDRLSTTQKYTHIVKADLKKMHGHAHPRERVAFVDIAYRGTSHEVG